MFEIETLAQFFTKKKKKKFVDDYAMQMLMQQFT